MFESLFEIFPFGSALWIASEFLISRAGEESGKLLLKFLGILGIERGKLQFWEFFRDFPLGDPGHHLRGSGPLREFLPAEGQVLQDGVRLAHVRYRARDPKVVLFPEPFPVRVHNRPFPGQKCRRGNDFPVFRIDVDELGRRFESCLNLGIGFEGNLRVRKGDVRGSPGYLDFPWHHVAESGKIGLQAREILGIEFFPSGRLDAFENIFLFGNEQDSLGEFGVLALFDEILLGLRELGGVIGDELVNRFSTGEGGEFLGEFLEGLVVGCKILGKVPNR